MGKSKKISVYLKETIDNYRDIIKLDKRSARIPIKEIVGKAVFNVKARFEAHKISVEESLPNEVSIKAKKNLIIGTINNLFDNSIYWLNYQDIKDKKILIKAYEKNGDTHLVIADNGKGFVIGFESAIMPFITGRKDESSMGIGLHLADQVMIAHRGILVEGDFKEEGLNEEFKDGAIIKLIFKV